MILTDIEQNLAIMGNGKLDEPVIMLNLLRYREVATEGFGVDGLSGRDAYGEYGRLFAKLHPRFGGEPIWMGKTHTTVIGLENERWDICILVRYPSRQHFLDMVHDNEYQKISPIREAALAESKLIEMSQLLPKPETS
tara:strand:- start:909 stop:1322 length:414 start_codon:yes stop_codon:yes gene_type:complete